MTMLGKVRRKGTLSAPARDMPHILSVKNERGLELLTHTFDYVEAFCNRRRHSTPGHTSPVKTSEGRESQAVETFAATTA